jgi:hypothetical protein
MALSRKLINTTAKTNIETRIKKPIIPSITKNDPLSTG